MANRTTVKETAALLGISPRRVRALADQGRIPGAYKMGPAWTFPAKPRVTPATLGPEGVAGR